MTRSTLKAASQIAAQRKSVEARIKRIEDAISKGKEYVETGKHSGWKGFRPLFTPKVRSGKRLPPHRDWVKNVFLRRMEMALSRAEKLLSRLT